LPLLLPSLSSFPTTNSPHTHQTAFNAFCLDKAQRWCFTLQPLRSHALLEILSSFLSKVLLSSPYPLLTSLVSLVSVLSRSHLISLATLCRSFMGLFSYCPTLYRPCVLGELLTNLSIISLRLSHIPRGISKLKLQPVRYIILKMIIGSSSAWPKDSL